jgi:outer membrane receptor protein involved in Fe transport
MFLNARSLVAALGLSAICVTSGHAQTPPPPPPPPQQPQQPLIVREQIEVVATRIPEVPHDVPVAIEVIDGETLRAIGATTVRDALSLAAGIEVASGGDGGPAGSVPEFWGLREFDAFLLVVDDIPWGGAFNPALTTLNLRDVERVEVLRGPAPVTYGATSFVGVIHVVHKPAAATNRYGWFSGGAFKTGTGGIDLPLPSMGAWKSRLTADVERQGFKDDRTSFARGHANLRATNAGTDRKTWFFADLNWLTQDPASPHVREGTSLSTATPLDANYNPANAFLDDTRVSAAYGFERPLGSNGVRWTLTTSYSHSGQDMFRGFLTDVSNTPNNATGLRETIDINDLYADTHFLLGRPNARIVAGGDFLFGNGEGRGATFTYTAPLAATTAPTVTEPTDLPLDTGSRRQFFGGYVSTEWIPTNRLHLSGGVRMNVTVERHGEGASTTHARPAASVGAVVSLWQRGVDHVKVYGDYRDTFKPAAFDFSLAENEGVLAPETARSFEGGLKARTASGRLDVEASAFRMDFHNLVTATVVGGLPSLQNAGQTRFQGFELAADARGPHSVSARASYSFHDGKFVDFVQAFDTTNTQLAGNRFEMSARHLLSAGLVIAPSTGLAGDAVLKYVGDRYLDKRNRALAPGFATLDAGLAWRVPRWEVRLDLRNLADRRDPVAESELGDAQYYRLNARRFDATYTVRF